MVTTHSCPLFLVCTVKISWVKFIDRVLVILNARRSQITSSWTKQDFLPIQIVFLEHAYLHLSVIHRVFWVFTFISRELTELATYGFCAKCAVGRHWVLPYHFRLIVPLFEDEVQVTLAESASAIWWWTWSLLVLLQGKGIVFDGLREVSSFILTSTSRVGCIHMVRV